MPARRPRPRRPLRVALGAGKAAALSALLMLVVAGGLNAAGPSARPDAVAQGHQRADQPAGTGDACPALIRTARGQLRQVSFAVGWDVYNGLRPGTLVAVCP
jgi:hypothetical protein